MLKITHDPARPVHDGQYHIEIVSEESRAGFWADSYYLKNWLIPAIRDTLHLYPEGHVKSKVSLPNLAPNDTFYLDGVQFKVASRTGETITYALASGKGTYHYNTRQELVQRGAHGFRHPVTSEITVPFEEVEL